MATREERSFPVAPLQLQSRTASSCVQVDYETTSLSQSAHAHNQFFVWREFLWGGIAGAVGEGMMHPVDTLKTRIQCQAIISGAQSQKSILQMVRAMWGADGLRGFCRGATPALTGSLATGATYFGFIESTQAWLEESHPSLGGHRANFLAGGEALGSLIYVPCEVMKQRMQVQGISTSWNSVIADANSGRIPGAQMYNYYNGMFDAGSSIWRQQGLKGLYSGSFQNRGKKDFSVAGFPFYYVVMFYKSLKDMTDFGKKERASNSNHNSSNSPEGLLLGGVAGELSAYITTPFDVIKTRLQVQGPTSRYSGWSDTIQQKWMIEGAKGFFRGSVPRIMWHVPASAMTFMAVEFLRDRYKKEVVQNKDLQQISSISVDKESFQEGA